MGKIFSIILSLILIVTGTYLVFSADTAKEDEVVDNNEVIQDEDITEDVFDAQESFNLALETRVREEIGNPIEGYEPMMFLDVFPSLAAEDFEGVRAEQGIYQVAGGEVLFSQYDDIEAIHSAAQAITSQGMEDLFVNVISRTGIVVNDEEALNELLNFLSDEAVAVESIEIPGEIIITYPNVNDRVSSPFPIRGTISKDWLDNDNRFPVKILDSNRQVIVSEDMGSILLVVEDETMIGFDGSMRYPESFSGEGYIQMHPAFVRNTDVLDQNKILEIPVYFR